MTEIHELTAASIAADVARGDRRATEIAEHFLDRIDRLDGDLHCFLSRDPSRVREDAAAVDARRVAGRPLGPLAGVPVAIKDNIAVKGGVTSCASRMLEGYVSPYDAAVIERLRAADAVILGKTNLDEFAMGSSTENSAFGATRNPWNRERVPGGSSGGSAAAVAAGLCAAALGSDTGGSIRQPASFCGVTGLKPTYGRVSRYGLVAFGSSLDQIGPLTRSAGDAALILAVLAGHDPRDSTSAQRAVDDVESGLESGVRGLRIGLPREGFDEAIDPRVRDCVRAAVKVLEEAGAELVDVELPHARYAVPAYYIVATAEASSNLARYGGVGFGHRSPAAVDIDSLFEGSRSEGFGSEVVRRILLGTHGLSSGYYDAFYDKAMRVRSLIRADYERAFEAVDVLVTPTAPTPPFALGEKTDDPLDMYLADILTVAVNLAGMPGVSVPAGFAEEGGTRLPIGMQIVANRFEEPVVLRTARAFEAATRHGEERPA